MIDETAMRSGDAVSLGVLLATLADWLPAVGALLTVLWTLIRIYETDTVQRLLGRQPAPGPGKGEG